MRNLGLMDPAFLGGLGGLSLYDPSAAAYITAVEAADGQALETGVRDAINAFVLDCKADGIWNAIKASCILAGAHTLAGALVPLVGAAPTNFNFVSGDYNRKTGLMGDGSTKYLNSNRNNNADPQSNSHLAVYATLGSTITPCSYIGAIASSWSFIDYSVSSFRFLLNSVPGESTRTLPIATTGLYGASRSNLTNINNRVNSITQTASQASAAPDASSLFVFARRQSGAPAAFSNARLAFYSIGESLDLALLDARVTALVNALAVAIP